MKTVIITGANSGLGFETAKKVAKNHEYEIIMACRNPEKAENARETIMQESANENVGVEILDTSSLASVRDFCDRLKDVKIDVLLNNAGISPTKENTGMTADGFELLFETNYLGHFLMTHLLWNNLNEKARILNVSSDMHNPPGGIKWIGVEELAHPSEDRRSKYSYTKLCMIYFTHSLVKLAAKDDRGITANAFNPGFMADTNFSKSAKAREEAVKMQMPERYSTLEVSSTALAELVAMDEMKENGAFFDRSTHTVPSSDLSYDEANEKELYEASLNYCGLA